MSFNYRKIYDRVVPAASAPPEILRFEGITRRFYGVTALDDVSFGVASGQIHAVMGANGAGKSTLMKTLVGINQPDSGQIFLNGRPVSIPHPRAAQALGIDIVFQEIELAPNLSVAESIFLAREHATAGVLRSRSMLAEAACVLQRLGLALSPETPVELLSVAEMQLVQIARALSANARVLVLDEPTSSLTDVEIARLFGILHQLRRDGHTLLYISHKIDEVFEVADTISVLRDGRHVLTQSADSITADELVASMIGEGKNRTAPARGVPVGVQPVLEVEDLARESRFRNVSFTLSKGEVLGFFGIVGAGRTEIARCLFGLDPFDRGQIRLCGRPVRFRSPAAAVKAGLAMVPEDRKQQGLILDDSILHNMSLPALSRLATAGVIKPEKEFGLAEQFTRIMGVVFSSLQQEVQDLSGGNQQKVVLGKWLATSPQVLILDEPTKGIDVGARAEVHRLIRQITAEGIAVILISSEIEEVMNLSDRILVLHAGRITAELTPSTASREEVLRFAVT